MTKNADDNSMTNPAPTVDSPASRQVAYTRPPWHLSRTSNGWCLASVGTGIALTIPPDDEISTGNAERIVSCVNALEGVSNPAAVKQLIQAARFLVSTWGYNLVPPIDYKESLVTALAALDTPKEEEIS